MFYVTYKDQAVSKPFGRQCDATRFRNKHWPRGGVITYKGPLLRGAKIPLRGVITIHPQALPINPVAKPVAPIPAVKEVAPEPNVVPWEKKSNYDFDEAHNKYAIGACEKFAWVPRDEFMTGLVTKADANAELEDVIAKGNDVLAELAKHYIVLRDKAARLPKFGKWVGSLYPGNEEYNKQLAKAGQKQGGELVISVDIVDIMRCADTPHFWSCLTYDGNYKDVTKAVCEKAPGIGIAYINAPDGKMKWRSWLHHAKDADGNDVVVAMHPYGQDKSLKKLAQLLDQKGIKLYSRNMWYAIGNEMEGVATTLTYVGAFTKSIHWDYDTWSNGGVDKFYKVIP